MKPVRRIALLAITVGAFLGSVRPATAIQYDTQCLAFCTSEWIACFNAHVSDPTVCEGVWSWCLPACVMPE